MTPYVVDKVKTLYLCGPTADAIQQAVMADPEYKPGSPEIVRTASLEESIDLARDGAKEGDIVLLSPACASFDAFPNFAARGKFFKEKVMSF